MSVLIGLIALVSFAAAAAEPGGADASDDLRWLEAPTSDHAIAWARGMTAASTAKLTARPGYQQVLRELQRTLDAARVVSDVALLGPYAVRFHRDATHPKGVLQRADRRGNTLGTWRTVLDVGALNRAENADYDLRWSAQSCLPPRFDRCLLSLGVAGGDEAQLREFDLAAGRFVEGGFSLAASRHVAAWIDRDTIVVGHDLAGARRTVALWPGEAHLWRRGTALRDGRKVFDAGSADVLFQLYSLGGDGRALLVQAVDLSTFNLHVIDVSGKVTRLALPAKLKLFGFQGATARHLFVQLGEPATVEGQPIPAESIVSYDLGHNEADQRRIAVVYTPAAGEAISSLGFATSRTRVVFPVRSGLQVRLLGARYDGRTWRVAPVASAAAGVDLRVTGADPIGEELVLLKEGFLAPPALELLREDGSVAVLQRSQDAFDASTHEVQARQVRSADGEVIDYLLVVPKKRGGKPVPTLMTGYGAFGISLSPAYPTSPAAQFYGGVTLKLWFERGGALVLPAIRGGGERGEAWHRAAMQENRQRSYDDFYAVANDVISAGITDRDHLGVFGTSNGGLLAAVAGLQRPDLFAAVVSDAPLADMLRFPDMGIGAAWTAEYGDPKDPRAAAWLARYSPLHNASSGVDYPAFLITVARSDNRVGPGHARKLAKRLSDVQADVLFLEAEAGGHDVSDPLLRPDIMAMRATFLFDHLQVPIGQPEVSSDAFVAWARERAVALQDFPSDTASTRAVHDLVAAARVVSLGEPAHGAHEPLAFRNRLFKYLVEELGFTAIALESGVSESRRVNDFVRGGPGEARDIARAGLTWGFGDYPENVELLQWIRKYNAESVGRRKVSFYGIDLSGGSDGEFTTARVALDDALAYLARVAPEASRSARSAIEPFLERFTRGKYQTLSTDERAHLSKAVDERIEIFARERPHLIAASSDEEFEWGRRSAIAASQVEQLFRLWPADTPADGVSAEFYRAAAARDAAMADNVRWALRREGASGRLLVYAHNAHVMNAVIRGGIWSVYPQPPAMMGRHLRAALGKDLAIIGVSAAEIGPGLPPAPASQESMEVALGRLGVRTLLLDMRRAADVPALTPWLSQLQSMRANFTTQMRVPPRDAFDAIVFIDRLSPAGSTTPH